jgi:hypothetical protein
VTHDRGQTPAMAAADSAHPTFSLHTCSLVRSGQGPTRKPDRAVTDMTGVRPLAWLGGTW